MRPLAFIAALVCAVALLFAASASAADSVYWSNDFGGTGGTLGRAALDGSGGSVLTPSPVAAGEPYGTAIDAATGRIYWADNAEGTNGKIDYANLDGTGSGTLDTAGSEIDAPEGLAIDPSTDRLYWANLGNDTISWAALDGSGGGVLDALGAPVAEPAGVVVDPGLGRLYWTSYEDSLIGWVNLDGSAAGEFEMASLEDLEGPTGLAIDAANQRLYWANYDTGTIGWATLDGLFTGRIETGALQTEGAAGIAIDPEARRLYWAGESGFIGEVSLEGGPAAALDIAGAEPAEPNFPVLLEAPKAVPAGPVPTDLRLYRPGATLTCGSPSWEPDLIESFLYRAPQSIAYSWSREGVPIGGATGQTLTAALTGEYTCQVIATNGAGSTAIRGGNFAVTVPASPEAAPPRGVLQRVRVIKVKRDVGRGSAVLLAKVTGPGKVTLSGARVVRRRAKAVGAGVVKLKVTAKGTARRALLATGKATVAVAVTFVSITGSTNVARRTVPLVRTLRFS